MKKPFWKVIGSKGSICLKVLQIGPYVMDCGHPAKTPLKVDMPNSFTYLDHTYIEWHVIRCGSKIKFQKDMFLKENRLHSQNMILTILDSNSRHS